MTGKHSVDFFDAQFRAQIARRDFALNPFEQAALPYLHGRVLDFGCGLGNLALHAARAGLEVVALDASPSAIDHLQQVAAAEDLRLDARLADLRTATVDGEFDLVASIGLLMFFDCGSAFAQLEMLKARVRPGGVAIVNVLAEGTTYLDMFSPHGHCLFAADALPARFADWDVLAYERSVFPAPGPTVKAFATLIARRPPEARTTGPGHPPPALHPAR